jgi:hypothetical protein
MKNVFQTGVLEKRDGHWVHVQMHGSYPVDRIPENLLHQFYADRFANSKTEKETNVPNPAPDPTALAVTPAADAPVAPAGGRGSS